MASKWQSRPKKRRGANISILAVGVSAFVLIVGIITAFGIHHSKDASSAKTSSSSEAERHDSDSSVLLAEISKATTANQPDQPSSQPKTNPAAQPAPQPRATTNPGSTVPTPTPSTPDIPPAVPPAPDFSIRGDSTISLGPGQSTVVSFSGSDASDAAWSVSGPEQNGIEVNYNAGIGPGFSVSFTAQEGAIADTQVAFTIHATDAARGISESHTIVVTITP